MEEWLPPSPEDSPPPTSKRPRRSSSSDEGIDPRLLEDLPGEAPKGEKPPPSFLARIAPDLPLVIIGVVFFVGAFIFFSHGMTFGTRIYPVWVLFVGLGSVATTGGLVSMYVGPEPPTLDREAIDLSQFVVIPKEEWERTRDEVARLRAQLGLPPPTTSLSPELSSLGLPEDRSHNAVLSQVESLGAIGLPPAPYGRPAPAARAEAQPGAAPVARPARRRTSWGPAGLPSEIVGPVPPEEGGGGAAPSPPPRVAPTPPPAPARVRPPPPPPPSEPTAPYVEVPTDLLQKELDLHIDSALRTAPPPRAPTPPPAPRILSEPVEPVPAPAPAPIDATYDENEPSEGPETGGPAPGTNGTAANEIEDLARKFGALVSPTGFMPGPGPLGPAPAPAPAARPPPSPREKVWYLPNLRALRPWPGSGRFEWELACLRVGVDYALIRLAGEEPEAFMDRAEVLLQKGVPIPPANLLDLRRAEALCACFLQAYRHLTTREIEAFDAQIRPELDELGKALSLPRGAGEDTLTHVQRLQGILPEIERAGGVYPAGPRSPPSTPPSAGASGAPEAREGEELSEKSSPDALDKELDRLVSEIDSSLPGPATEGSADARRKKRAAPKSEKPGSSGGSA